MMLTGQQLADGLAALAAMTEETEALLSSLRAIAQMKITDATNHAQLSALCIAIANTALRKFCCGDAVCFNESNGVECAALLTSAIPTTNKPQ